MKKTRPIAILVLILIYIFSGCNSDSEQGNGSQNETTFDKSIANLQEISREPTNIGVSYYPERRPVEKWKEDFDKMIEAGIKSIRIAEFSWSELEPVEGIFNWGWLDSCIEQARKNGLSVVLCTPTATPPIWLVEKYPDVLPVDKQNRKTVFGGRQHRDYHSENYKKYSFRIVELMAKRYGYHRNVNVWQLDNEFGGEQKWSFSEASIKAFRDYLKKKYKTIGELNKRWMNEFWSMDYQRFDQIKPPFDYHGTLMLKHHPSLELEFKRFASESIVNYSNKQAAIIRKFSKRNTKITHNRFSYQWGDNVNSYNLNKQLDIAGYDLYSRNPYEIAFYADLNTTLNPQHSWVMEYSTGSNNLWDELEIMSSRGIQWIYFFKWNPFPAGQEQGITSLLTIMDKKTPNFHVLKKWNEQIVKKGILQTTIPSGLGIYYDFESSWIDFYRHWGNYPDRLKYQDYLINTVYKSVYEKERSVKVILDPSQIRNLHTLILPLHIMYSESLETTLISFVERGGQLITTDNVFQKNEDNVYLTELPRFYKNILLRDDFFHFIDDGDKILLNKDYGKGRVIVVNSKSNFEDWKTYKERFDF